MRTISYLKAVVQIICLTLLFQPAFAAEGKLTADEQAERHAFAIGYQAYLQGHVYVKSMLLKEEAIHPKYRAYTPINSILTQDTLAKPGFTDFTPNNDTLYGLGWLDLSQGPILMEVPEITDRYWVMQATDYALHSLDYLGSRVGSKPGVYAYAHEDWEGQLPPDVKRIDSQTNTVFLQLRTLVRSNVEGDLEKVVAINRSFTFTPLNKKAQYPAISADTPMRAPQVTNSDYHNLNFFRLYNEALTKDAPRNEEEAMVTQFAELGIGPGLEFNPDNLTEAQRRGLQQAIDFASQRMLERFLKAEAQFNGWNFNFKIGTYHPHDMLLRASASRYGYGGNNGIEALYPLVQTDDKGEFLTGERDYVIQFAADQLPQVHAFWSVTMYRRPDNQLVENSIDRYAINDRTPGLQYNDDGSLDIYISANKPKDGKASNWLPAPADRNFWLILRMYNPKAHVLEGKYHPPAVTRLK